MSAPFIQREPLPTKEQIFAICSVDVLGDIRDNVQQAILAIESQLEFLDGSDEWAKRAVRALALHRFVDRQIIRRMSQLEERSVKHVPMRPADANDPLTQEMLERRPTLDAEALVTLQECDAAAAWILDRLNAVTIDREDEIGLAPTDRDERFLASTGAIQRLLKALRVSVQNRAAVLRKAEKVAVLRREDGLREREFVDIARIILDRETFLKIWGLVEVSLGSRSPI